MASRATARRSTRRAVGGVGGDRSSAVSCWCAAVFARDVRWAGAQFSRHPVDGRRASGRDGGRAGRARLAMAVACLRVCGAPWRGGTRAVGRPRPVRAGGDVQGRTARVARGGDLLRGGGHLVALTVEGRARRRCGCRDMDTGRAVGARGGSGRRPAPRHISRRGPRRLGLRALSARRHAAHRRRRSTGSFQRRGFKV